MAAQVIAHPTRMMEREVPSAELVAATAEHTTAMGPPLLHFAASLPSATPEDHEAPSVDNLDLDYLNKEEARQVRDMLRQYSEMSDGS